MSESPRDTLAPGVVGQAAAARRGLLWPLVTGAALAGLAVGGRFAGGVFGPEPPPAQAQAAASQTARESAPPKPVALARAAPLPSAEPAPIPTPVAVPAAPPDRAGPFFVQVASFEVKENADALARELTKLGFSAHSEAYGGPGAGWWHVVRIGPFQSRAEAEERRLKLPSSTAAFVLPRPNGVYHLQVASLKSAAKAEQLAGRLRRRGHHVRVTEVPHRGQRAWHCVRVGPFDSREEAEGYRILFEAREGIGGRVIPFAPEAPTKGT